MAAINAAMPGSSAQRRAVPAAAADASRRAEGRRGQPRHFPGCGHRPTLMRPRRRRRRRQQRCRATGSPGIDDLLRAATRRRQPGGAADASAPATDARSLMRRPPSAAGADGRRRHAPRQASGCSWRAARTRTRCRGSFERMKRKNQRYVRRHPAAMSRESADRARLVIGPFRDVRRRGDFRRGSCRPSASTRSVEQFRNRQDCATRYGMKLPQASPRIPIASRGRLHPEADVRPARPARHLPARPRPHHPFRRLPPPSPQDPGVRRPRRRPFPRPPDPQPRSRADRPDHGPRARPQRGSDRSSVPSARPRPPAVRPRRRGCADAALADAGGFDHNAHTLRIVTRLENPYPDFDGLNLSWEALEGLAKHNGPVTEPTWAMAEANAECDLELGTWPSLEAQVAAIADDIAYDNHDIDDGLRAGLLQHRRADRAADREAALWDAIARAPSRHSDREAPARAGPRHDRHDGRRRAGRDRSGACAKPASRRSTTSARAGRPLAGFSDALAAEERALKRFLYARLYDLPELEPIRDRGRARRRQPRRRLSRRSELLPEPGSAAATDAAVAHHRRLHRRHDRPLRHRPARGTGRTGQPAATAFRASLDRRRRAHHLRSPSRCFAPETVERFASIESCAASLPWRNRHCTPRFAALTLSDRLNPLATSKLTARRAKSI